MKKNFTHSLSVSYGNRLHPRRDWFVLLWVSLAIFLASVFWNAWTFNQAATGVVLGGAAVEPPQIFNPTSITQVQKIFSDRASEEATYITGAHTFIDPSK